MLINYDQGYTEFLRKKLLFQLGYYRTASDANSIVLADGRREMADSEFGTGTNAEKVNISHFCIRVGQILLSSTTIFTGINVVIFHSLRQIQTVHLVRTVTAHILEYIKN